MKLFLVRHGQSEANAMNMHAGWSPTPLTEEGIRQAEAVRPLLKDVHFSEIYVSDLPRARQTADIIFGDREKSFIWQLREINMEKISGINFSELERIYGEKYLQCRKRWDFSPFGCESVPEFLTRVNGFFDKLEEKYVGSEDNIAIVAHAGIIRAAARKVVGLEISDRYSMKIDNASVTVVGIYPNRGWRIEHWNYTPKLF